MIIRQDFQLQINQKYKTSTAIQKQKYIGACMSNNMQQRVMQKYQPFKCQLQRLFVYYSSFGDKDNPVLLKIQNYRRLLTDMQLIPPPPNNNNQASLANQCDVIFYSKACPATALSFNAFLELLQPLALLFFAENSFDQLLKFHLQPLHDHIMKQTQFGESIALISPQFLKESSYKFLERFQETLSLIYGRYFMKSGKGGEQDELKTFTKLSRQLGLTPKVISRPVAYLAFLFLRSRDSVIAFKASSQQKRSKFRFDFTCFLDYLILLSQLSRRGPETDQTKIYYLLQSIQVSQGYQSISKIVKLQHFFVTNDMLEEEVKPKKVMVEKERTDQRLFQVVQAPLRKKLGEYYETLKAKFVKLCVKKHVQSNFYLNEGVVMKMLARICPKLSQNTCELLITSVGKLSFENFVTLINLTAQKLKIDRQKLYEEVARYTEGSSSIALVIENMQLEQEEQENCIQILRLSHSYLRTLFDFYEFKGTLSLPNYLKFYQQTELIPKVLKVIEASDIFAACEKGSSLTFQQFQQSFLRLIISVHFPHELQGVQRLLYILQIICKSKRGETLMKKNLLLMKQHPLYKIRIIFEETYRRMHAKIQSR